MPVVPRGIAGRRAVMMLPAVVATAAVLDRSAPAAANVPAGAPDAPLGIGLEGWPYPYPVSFLDLTMSSRRVRMAYMDVAPVGVPNGRTVILLHGKNFDGSYWSGPIDWLRRAGFRVVAPDQIGFNKSAKPDLRYTFEALAHNTMALADALSLGRVALLGHSTGGALAVVIASLFPDRVERLVLEDPIGLVDYRRFIPPQTTDTLVAAEHAYTEDSYRAFIAHFFHALAPDKYEPFVVWRMRTTLSGEFDRFAKAAALTYQMIFDQPTRRFYAGLTMPVLLTAGTDDRSTPLVRYASPEARARIPSLHEAAWAASGEPRHATFVSFPDTGHVPHLEQPDRFRPVLLDFLRT